MKKLLVLLLLSVALSANAQEMEYNRPTSYNYIRGMEAVQEDMLDEALVFFNKDIEENPDNGYSYSWIAVLRANEEEYGQALTAVDKAIKLLPKEDTAYVIFSYSTRADIYLNLEDTVKAISDLTRTIKIKPDLFSSYEKRAQIYYEQKRYILADADYRKMIELMPGETTGYMGLGRIANEQKKWDDAIQQFDYVIKLASNYSSAYSFRAESYIGKEKWAEATNDILMALSIDLNTKAVNMINTLQEPAASMLVSKIKLLSAKLPNDGRWPFIIGAMYEYRKQYAEAINYYEEANSKDVSPAIHQRVSECYIKLGDYDDALNSINKAINLDSTYLSYKAVRAKIYYELGNIESTISEWNNILATDAEYVLGYYQRGWFKKLAGDMEGAIEDLSMSIVIDPTYSHAYVSRGDIYKKQDKKELAEADFKKVIEIEDSPEKYECIHFAYQGLGDNHKAIAAIDTIIARDSTNAGRYYDAACLYSLPYAR